MNMDEQTARKTYKYKLKPTPTQEQALAFVLRRCRELYNADLEERQQAWHKRGASITLAGQSAQLPDIKEARPEYPLNEDVDHRFDVLRHTRDTRSCQITFMQAKSGLLARRSTTPVVCCRLSHLWMMSTSPLLDDRRSAQSAVTPLKATTTVPPGETTEMLPVAVAGR